MSDLTNVPRKLLSIKAELSAMIEKYATSDRPIDRTDFIKLCAHLRHVTEKTIRLQNKLNAILNEESHPQRIGPR